MVIELETMSRRLGMGDIVTDTLTPKSIRGICQGVIALPQAVVTCLCNVLPAINDSPFEPALRDASSDEDNDEDNVSTEAGLMLVRNA